MMSDELTEVKRERVKRLDAALANLKGNSVFEPGQCRSLLSAVHLEFIPPLIILCSCHCLPFIEMKRYVAVKYWYKWTGGWLC
jgi:hypothetical protein